jgi:hypothetical protein
VQLVPLQNEPKGTLREGPGHDAVEDSDRYSYLRNLGADVLVSSAWTCRPDETLDRSTTARWRRCAGSLSGA